MLASWLPQDKKDTNSFCRLYSAVTESVAMGWSEYFTWRKTVIKMVLSCTICGGNRHNLCPPIRVA